MRSIIREYRAIHPSIHVIEFKTFFYVVRHLDSIVSYLPTGLHLGFFRSWPSLFLPSTFSSVFLVLSFVSASTSMLFWAVFLLPFFEHGHTMSAGSVQIIELYLTEIRSVSLMFVVCLVGVWQRNFEPGVCVCTVRPSGQ